MCWRGTTTLLLLLLLGIEHWRSLAARFADFVLRIGGEEVGSPGGLGAVVAAVAGGAVDEDGGIGVRAGSGGLFGLAVGG